MLNRSRLALSALATTALVATTGCGALDDGGGDGRPTVAAGFYPLAWVAEQVAGEHAEVTNLTRPGQEAHDAELSLASTAKVANADLVIVNGGFQPALDDTAAENATGTVLDVADVVTLLPLDHAHEDEEHDHDHAHTGDHDPHFWLDPLLMADLADAVAAELGEVDPDHAAEFEESAAALREELTAVDAAYTEGLGQCERDTVVVSHDAFGYLARYGLHFESIAGLSPGAEPTPADLARLQDVIREEGLTTVFTETLAPPALAGQLADDMGVATAVLDPIEGLVDTTADEDYLSLMEANLTALVEANGC